MPTILVSMPDLLPTAEHIQQRVSSTAGEAPPALEPGELAVNLADEVVWVGKGAGKTPIQLGKGGPVSYDAGEFF